MANLTPNDTYGEVYELGISDFVQGGPGGTANLQPQQLLNNVTYLKNRMNIRKVQQDFDLVDECGPADFAEHKTILVTGDNDALLTLTLAEIADFTAATEGMSVRIKNGGQFDGGGSQFHTNTTLRVKCNGSEAFIVSEGNFPGDNPLTHIDLFTGETIELTVLKNGTDFCFFVSGLERKFPSLTGIKEVNTPGNNTLTVGDLNSLINIHIDAADTSIVLPLLSSVREGTTVNVIITGDSFMARVKQAVGDVSGIYFNGGYTSEVKMNSPEQILGLTKLAGKWYTTSRNFETVA